ncbi:MAG: hypothetical protein MJZ31_07855 [Bacteroidales bacterium]|nr:hypothetical protein [Bacteroidales bacterium]
MTQKEKYIQLSEKVKLPLAMQPWWLDIVSSEKGKGWDAIVVEDEKGEIIGAMPYHYVKKLWLTFVVQPQLTMHMGIWMRHLTEGKKVSEYDSVASKIIKTISDEVDRRGIFYLNMKLGIDSIGWQALEWNGFLCRVRYTYVMKEIPDSEDGVYKLFRKDKQKKVNKAFGEEWSCRINIVPPSQYYDLYSEELKTKNDEVFYSKKLFCQLFDEAVSRSCARIISIHDKQGNIHAAALYTIEGENSLGVSTYINPEFKSDGSSSLVVLKQICDIKSSGCISYNHGGGTNEGMASSYAGIGTEKVAYLQIIKIRGLLGRILMRLAV